MTLEDALKMATLLMCENNLSEWKFVFDRAKKRFGMCNFSKKTISLSAHLVLLNDETTVKNTIVHEIAHALCGFSAGHGTQWKNCMKKLGGIPKRCYEKNVHTPPLAYTVCCHSCQNSFQRNRYNAKIACALCCQKYNGGKFSEKFLLHFQKNK